MSRLVPMLAAVSMALFTGCALRRSVSLAVTQEGNDPVFHLRTHGMNGLLGIRLWRADTKEVLWDVNLNYYRENRLRYGEIPTAFRTFNGGLNQARQNHPPEGQKPALLPHRTTFMVELDCQYDTLLSPAVQKAYFLFSTDRKGALSHVTKLEGITGDDLPSPK